MQVRTIPELKTQNYRINFFFFEIQSDYELQLNLILDHHNCLAHSQVLTVISLLEGMKGWSSDPDILIDDTDRTIELHYLNQI